MTHRLRLASLAGLSALAFSGAVQAEGFFDLRPGSVYAASSIGFVLAPGYECNGAPVCEQDRIGGKLFGGYRFTPNLAAEVGYFYLGHFQATEGTNVASNAVASRSLTNRAVTLGLDWSGEMFSVLTQHIRFGMAHVSTAGTVSYGDGSVQNIKEDDWKPYIGLGLSYQFNPHVRFYQSYDYLRNKQNKHFHMFTIGVGVEN